VATRVAEQFDDARQQKESATVGMWIFLATEIMFFGGMFLGYAVYRSSYPAAFGEASRRLDIVLGAINTAILLTSSLTMAMAVHAAHAGKRRKLVGFLVATIVLGLGFLGIKFYEYFRKFEEHLVPGRTFSFEGANGGHAQLFFSFYFAMTGMHALHMVIGIVMMGVLIVLARRGRFSPEYYNPVEMSGLYWHFVDIVWVFLFPLLYLVERS
jgi:cytochrome c oxidase subunit 3